MAFNIKKLRLTYRVRATNTTYEIDGLPITANLNKTGGYDALMVGRIVVHNLSLEHANAITIQEWKGYGIARNDVLLEAKEGDGDWFEVFKGNAVAVLPKINENGTMDIRIEAYPGVCAISKSAKPTSVSAEMSATELFKQFATEGTLDFRDLGIKTHKIKNSVFTGTALEKATQLAKQIHVDMFVDNNVLVVKEFDGTSYETTPIISPSTGMIGYPTWIREGLQFRCLLRQDIKFGSIIQLQSVMETMCGKWKIFKLDYKLDAYYPQAGDWYMEISAHHLDRENPYGMGRG